MEREYRDLFKEDTDVSQELEVFSSKGQKGGIDLYARAFFSITMLLTYIPLIAATIIIMFFVGG